MRDPDGAQYLVLTNYCNETRPDLSIESMVAGGYGSGIGSSIVSSLSTAASMASAFYPAGAIAGGIASSAIGTLGGLFSCSGGPSQPKQSDEIIYACVADLQITDRITETPAPSPFVEKQETALPPGVHQTRSAASIHQRKLNEAEATPLLQHKLSAAVAGHF